MGYSRSGVARFLVEHGNAPEPFVRSVLAELLPMCYVGKQMVSHDPILGEVLGIYGNFFLGWATSGASLMQLAAMLQDLQMGDCVAQERSIPPFIEFCRSHGLRVSNATRKRMFRRAKPWTVGGVITTPDFGIYIPSSLMEKWLEFLGLPEELVIAFTEYCSADDVQYDMHIHHLGH